MFEMLINYITYLRTGIKATDVMNLDEFMNWLVTKMNTTYVVNNIIRYSWYVIIGVIVIVLIKNLVKMIANKKVEA